MAAYTVKSWYAKYIQKYARIIVSVSKDREFCEQLCTSWLVRQGWGHLKMAFAFALHLHLHLQISMELKMRENLSRKCKWE